MKCRLCGSETKEVFEKRVLGKYLVKYHQCTECKFVQTDNPHWLDEAYESAITSLDLGYLTRNIVYAKIVDRILKYWFSRGDNYLDYGGGYGVFVRLMRDRGWNFHREDPYCENLFASGFDISDRPIENRFGLLTSFEVFEHLANPISDIDKMFQLSDSVLFSTELQPSSGSLEDWWYLQPETGQHVALYHRKSLDFLAQRYSCQIYSDGASLHLLSKKVLRPNPVLFVSTWQKVKDKLSKSNFYHPQSLLQRDFQEIKSQLENQK